MKFISKLAVSSAVIALAFLSTANAQAMRIDVPFAFNAGSVSLPAGTYHVSLNQTSQRVSLSKLDGKKNCFLTVKSMGGSGLSDRSSLVFNQYGSSYFLTRVKTIEGGSAELFTSRAERELANSLPNGKPAIVIASGR